MSTDPINLTDAQRQAILRFVRDESARHLGLSAADEIESALPELSCGGLFVTFKSAHRLRGCMGLLGMEHSLAAALSRATVMALSDPRFVRDPIRGDELDELTVEVSILSALQKVNDFSRLVAGRHGVVISRDDRQGCFLPQVASERGWDMPTLLSECCRLKADLPHDAWKNPQTTVRSFEAVVICGAPTGRSA